MWIWSCQTFSRGFFKQLLNIHIQGSVTLLKIQACFLHQIIVAEHVIFCGFIWGHCWACASPAIPGIQSCPSGTLVLAWHRCVRGLSVNQTDGGNELCEKQVFTALLSSQPPLAACLPAHTCSFLWAAPFLINSRNHLSQCSAEHLVCLSSSSPAPLKLLLHGSCLFLFIPSQRLPQFSFHPDWWHHFFPC